MSGFVGSLIFGGGRSPAAGGTSPLPDVDSFTLVEYADSPITLEAGGKYRFDTTNGAIVANMPATINEGDVIDVYFAVVDDTKTVTFDAGTNTIDDASTLVAGVDYLETYHVIFGDSTAGNWDVNQLTDTDGGSGLSSVGESSAAAIRALTVHVAGSDVQNFYNGVWYEYDQASFGVDDGTEKTLYIKPNNVLTADPGRWAIKRGQAYDFTVSLTDETSDITEDDDIKNFPIERGQLLNKLVLTFDPTNAPTGSSTIVDVLLDGVTILNNPITLPSGSYRVETVDFAVDYLPSGSVVTIDTTQVGATNAGNSGKVVFLTTLL